MKYIVIVLLFASLSVGAQSFSDPQLQSLVDAEKAFSRMATEKNTRDAFVSNLTGKSIGFYPEPGNALKHWEAQTPGTELLFWQPEFAFLSASGDYGYTYGPWSYSKSRTDKPEAYGHFITVWEKQSDGKWKVAVDVGVRHDAIKVADIPVQTSSIKPVASSSKDDLAKIEKIFLSRKSSDPEKAYFDYASTDIRFFRTGNYMMRSMQDAISIDGSITHQMAGSSISSTGDLGFVYGTATITETIKGEKKTRTAKYLHIWKKEEGKNWKIVVDVVS